MSDEVMEAGGIKNIKMKEIKRKQVQSDVVEDLADEFGKDWEVVLSQSEEEYVHDRILKKLDGKYYIVKGESFDLEELNEDF